MKKNRWLASPWTENAPTKLIWFDMKKKQRTKGSREGMRSMDIQNRFEEACGGDDTNAYTCTSCN
jgi:hypothetical protein